MLGRPSGRTSSAGRVAGHEDRPGRYGVRLVAAVGSGPFKGYTMYFISSDHGSSFGCTTGVTSTPVGPITCTGPSNDKNAEWPAITTTAKPVAGRGVHQSLLGRVYRKGVGWQVTYAGHPLYLFDQQPGAVTGEGWFEPGLPPWHGIWWLISASGEPVPWAGTLTTTKIGGKTVLAEPFLTGIGWVNFPVYTFTGDEPYFRANCSASAACARAWPPVLTDGARAHRRERLCHRRDPHPRLAEPGHLARPPALPVQPRGPGARRQRRRRAGRYMYRPPLTG